MKWITVSRKMGTHGSEIARRWPANSVSLLRHQAINHMAQELASSGSVREIDEKVPSIFQRRLFPRPWSTRTALLVIYELAKQGDAVFLGRWQPPPLAGLSLRLHVRVTASPETCIQTLLNKVSTARRQPVRSNATDDERGAFVRLRSAWTGRTPRARRRPQHG